MPGCDGLELASKAKRLDRELPVLLVTGSMNAETRRSAERIGCAACLEKPITIGALVEMVGLAMTERQYDEGF